MRDPVIYRIVNTEHHNTGNEWKIYPMYDLSLIHIFIGRRKFSDIELEDDEKDPAAHNVVAQDNRDDEEHKIVRMNVPFAQPCLLYTS